ncbi:MAG: hypothetical protein FJZ01_27875, partial [Candidatus Sericytochromatia bacterium]|nr:hypothetical protein [Candidatus Tanganyikabacteria bacterium]
AGAAPVAAVASAAPIVVAFGASVGVLALTLWGSAALIKAAMDRKN